MPEYLQHNALSATAPLPDFYWTGESEMNCLRQATGQTLDHGYAHHIQRMSNYCNGCRFDPSKATGDDTCPFTTLYGDFLQRHKSLLASNQRMSLQVKNLERKSETELATIRHQAAGLRERLNCELTKENTDSSLASLCNSSHRNSSRNGRDCCVYSHIKVTAF